MISDIETYKTYLAINSHFTSNYDYFKYNGKINASIDAFNKRRDKYFFQKAAKKWTNEHEFVEYLVAQFISKRGIDKKFWVGELFSTDAEKNFRKTKKTLESLSYTFKQDLNKIKDTKDRFVFNTNSEKHPSIYRLFVIGDISLETVCILDQILHFTDKWCDDMLLDEFKKLINDYKPFLMRKDINLTKYKTIVKEVFN